MYRKRCVMSVIHNGYPLKEDSGKIFMPFGSDYSIRLKNKHNEACVAKLFIDGVVTNKLGDFIIQPNSSIEIDRFVDKSLDKGEKFKFVEISNKEVDDPTSEENGIVRVEFRLGEKITNDVWADVHQYFYNTYQYPDNNTIKDFYASDTARNIKYTTNSNSVVCGMSANSCSKKSDGATIRGDESKQNFSYGFVELSDEVITMELKIAGVVTNNNKRDKYCSLCGTNIRSIDRYCFNCGRRITRR